jgi:hypothetical protein
MKDLPAIAELGVDAYIVDRRSDSRPDKRYTAMYYAALARQVADENESSVPKICLTDPTRERQHG